MVTLFKSTKGIFFFPFSILPLSVSFLSVPPVLDQLLMELHRFLLILDKETLSGNATVQKGLLSDLLQSYGASNGMRERKTQTNRIRQKASTCRVQREKRRCEQVCKCYGQKRRPDLS